MTVILFIFFRKFRYNVGRFMENVYFRIFTLSLILIDVGLVIVDLATPDDVTYHEPLEITSRVIIGYFVAEVLVRMFYKG